MTPSTFLLVLFSVGLGVAGQLLLKQGVISFEGPLRLQWATLVSVLAQPWVVLGFVCYGIASISWLLVLSRAPLGVAYPMLSLGYVAVALVSWQLFGESLNAARVAGIFLVCAGVILLAQS